MPMRNYWIARLQDANEKICEAPTSEVRRIFEALAGHYSALERQCRLAPLQLRADHDSFDRLPLAA